MSTDKLSDMHVIEKYKRKLAELRAMERALRYPGPHAENLKRLQSHIQSLQQATELLENNKIGCSKPDFIT